MQSAKRCELKVESTHRLQIGLELKKEVDKATTKNGKNQDHLCFARSHEPYY